MPLLRLLFAGLVAFGVMIMAVVAAIMVMVAGLIAALTGGKIRVQASARRGTRPPPRPPAPMPGANEPGVIDVESRRVDGKPPERLR